MKKVLFVLLLSGCATLAVFAQKNARKQPVDYVDPMMGNHDSRWMMFPGPSMPFGMVKLSPDNERNGWKAGYEYELDNITGFSHIHEWTMAGLLLAPQIGELQTQPGTEKDPDSGYRSRFRHETEKAEPGYYTVFLDDSQTKAELTTTTRSGFQRYTFPRSDSARVLIDLDIESEYGNELFLSEITRASDTEIEGYAMSQSLRGAGWNDYTVHFVIRFNKPFLDFNGWTRDGVIRQTNRIFSGWDHTDIGAFVHFNTQDGQPLLIQTGISLVSIEQARLNLDTELAKPFGWDFDAVRKHARDTWNELLSAIEVEGGDEADKKKFYTNMYRSYAGRNIWSDVNGAYLDVCEMPRKLEDPDSPMLGGDAFWNTFWNLNQLWTLATPDIANQWVRALLEYYETGGWLPKGPPGIEYSGIMEASHEIELIVAAYQKGIRNYDVRTAYEAIRHVQSTLPVKHMCSGVAGNRFLEDYLKYGYVPYETGPVSNTLEYAFDDWAVSEMARALGKTEDQLYFRHRAHNYLNLWDPSVGYMNLRRKDGTFVEGFDPYCCSTFLGQGWMEGNAWQYSWFVPHDLSGLIGLMGRDEFNERLQAGFVKSREWRFNSEWTDENNLLAMGVLPINHGNQPNMQAAYLFNYSGQPWRTQYWAREIMDIYYGAKVDDAWPGDEDQGQMGAWYVMSALGLFEMKGGCETDPVIEIGSPIFSQAVVRLDPRYYKGGTFTIKAINNSKENRYIQSATLDGKPLNKPWFYFRELADGGSLELIMGPEPNKSWGSRPEDAPPSMSNEK